MTIYRRIYEKHFGPIPRDEQGRSYEIHHIDGNRKNNNISNLKCLSIQEHYDVHFLQEDWGACFKISKRMDITPEDLSKLASLHNKKRVLEGKNPFVGPNINEKRLKNGTHHLLGGEIQRKAAIEQSKLGIHPFQIMKKEGNHPTQIEWKCECCGKIGKNIGNYYRFHGDNCKKG